MSQRSAIVARGIFKQFDGNAVLKGVDFELLRGEIHAVVGQNGAGKSTLMKVLNGTHQADRGDLQLFGQTVQLPHPSAARQQGIAMVYQELSLVASMSVADNIFLNNWLYASGVPALLDQAAMHIAAQILLEKVGLAGEVAPDQLLETLSMGQRQLVEIAKALSSDARIIILDEPTASLSDQEIAALFAVIRRLRDEGVSIIYITHYLRDIFKICDRVSVLRDGRCVARLAVSATSVPDLVALMLGEAARSYNWQRAAVHCSATPLLEVEQLVTESLNDVSFKVYPGQVVGLAGLLGSGRSEILNAIFGLDRIISGQILLDGQPVQIRSPAQAIAQGINLVPEDRRSQGLILDFSVKDNFLLCSWRKLANPLFIDQNRCEQIAHDLVSRLQLKTAGIEQAVRYLSGGNQQKVVIGKCLHTQAKVLLLDDPTFGIDLAAKHEIMRIVNDYVQQGNAVVFVSSEYSEIASFCDTTYIVKKGRICEQFTAISEERLLAAVQ